MSISYRYIPIAISPLLIPNTSCPLTLKRIKFDEFSLETIMPWIFLDTIRRYTMEPWTHGTIKSDIISWIRKNAKKKRRKNIVLNAMSRQTNHTININNLFNVLFEHTLWPQIIMRSIAEHLQYQCDSLNQWEIEKMHKNPTDENQKRKKKRKY